MSPTEALWFGKILATKKIAELSPMLNLGSSTTQYRTDTCPHIDKFLFAPLTERGVRVIHSDLKVNEGVDFVGNVLEESTRKELSTFWIRSILCNNLFEHVQDIESLCAALTEICPIGGLLFLSVPYKYPYHPDPIDNGFRPSLEDLQALLLPHGFQLVVGEIVDFGSYWRSLNEKRWLCLRDVFMLAAGIVDRNKWRVLFENYRYLFRQYRVTCAVFVMSG